VRRTQATLQRALIDLVQEQDLSQITVADVADRADVSRSTFYDHYRDVHDLAEAACTVMLDDMFALALALDTAPGHPPDPREDPDPALTTPRRRTRPAHPASPSTCPQRSSPAHSSAWPPTGCSAAARERRSR
jgi:AcrR family transcriptional regulator